MDEVFKALADPTRRELLDRLNRRDGQTQAELIADLPTPMSRFGAMKHLRILEAAGLVATRRIGREKLHYLNPVPIRLIHDRWVSKYAEPWAGTLAALKAGLEAPTMADAKASNANSAPRHVYEIDIRTTPERLWQAITSAADSVQYFYGNEVHSDWKVGSPYMYTDGGEVAIEGTIVEIDPPRRLVQTFHMTYSPELAADRPSRVTWEIEQRGELCRLILTHDEFESTEQATYGEVEHGWVEIISGLKTLLETGAPLHAG